MMRRIITFLALIVLVLAVSSTASAQEETVPTTCTGTVVDVGEDGLITIDPDPTVEGDECTVTLTSDYGHPITTLLGTYFSDVNAEDLVDALETAEVCVVQDPDTFEWTISDVEPCEMVTVTGDNGDGTFSAQPEEGDPIILTVDDEETAGDLTDALDSLNVDFDLNEDGSVVDVGDEIGQYHEDGYGFGVLVKVYAIVAELEESCMGESEPIDPLVEVDPAVDEGGDEVDLCGTTVENLIALVEGGAGMGDLFAIYGKPSMVGVGHVRNDGGSGDGKDGVCNARRQGGNANATGQGDIDCGTIIPNKDKDKTDKPDEGDDGDD